MKFLKSVKDEIKQITWPNGKQPHKDMLVIIETFILFGLMFYVMGTAVQSLLGWVLE